MEATPPIHGLRERLSEPETSFALGVWSGT